MAIRLVAWLEETFATQLLLGNSWLQEKNTQRALGIKLDPERAWRGLYHDNGSCLDISNDTDTEHKCYLKIIQLSPLVLTDGVTHLPAFTSPECLAYLRPRARLYDLILVRKHTIRYTPYGPPRQQLQFILQAVDWLGPNQEGVNQADVDETKPLWSDELAATLGQLRNTRELDDRVRLCSQDRTTQVGSALAMGRTREPSPGPSQPDTQLPFGTQIPRSARVRPAEDEPKFIGVKRMEPVLGGNTQREEIPPRAIKPSNTTPAELLSLLKIKASSTMSKAPAKSPHASPRRAVSKPQTALGSSTTELQTQLPVHVNRQPTQTQVAHKNAAQSPPRHAQISEQAGNSEVGSPRPRAREEQQTETATSAQESQGSHIQKLALDCPWMHDFEFTRECFNVPLTQLNLLRNDDSWYKPLIGHRFPDSNVPAKILRDLHRLIDEKADMEAEPSSDEYMEEDPSPEFPVESVNPSPDSVLQPTQDDIDASSQVSWSQSLSPEPPKMSTRANQQLPPDSSFELVKTGVGRDTENVDALPQLQHPISISSSIENDAPPSSPPIERKDKVAFDEDTEMEEYLPQGLGEDAIEGASGSQNHRIFSISSPSQPVVQVKETPYVKGKNGERSQLAVSPAREQHNSSGTSKYHSSTSIVYATYNDKASSNSQGKTVRSNANKPVPAGKEKGKLQLEDQPLEFRQEVNRQASRDNIPHMAEFCASSPEVMVALPQENSAGLKRQLAESQIVTTHEQRQLPSASAHMPPSASGVSTTSSLSRPVAQGKTKETASQVAASDEPSLTSGPVKRKLDDQLSKRHSRQFKRREIKIVGFGEDSPDSADPAAALRAYREESLRRFREARQSRAGFDSRSAFAEKSDLHGEDVETDSTQIDSHVVLEKDTPNMSPRHESLYAEPSASEPASKATPVSHPSLIKLPGTKDQLSTDTNLSTLHSRTTERPVPSTTSNVETTSNVYDLFKAAYPEYTGDVKHFQGQCTQMIQLDTEDKMVPKWQWDDYIIRNRADYKDYALECVDRGENPEPYHRFYKDTICDTIYRKGVIVSRPTLLKALEQLNVQIPALRSGDSVTMSTKKAKRSRASLPSAFNEYRVPTKNHMSATPHKRPRHSLPAQSEQNHHTPIRKLPVTEIPNSAPPNGSPPSGPSDPFRDFYFAWQRTTSLTGSTKVDPQLPWPRNLAVRPSIADVPKKKVDVLKWRDEL